MQLNRGNHPYIYTEAELRFANSSENTTYRKAALSIGEKLEISLKFAKTRINKNLRPSK